jgi:flagellar protein FliJ
MMNSQASLQALQTVLDHAVAERDEVTAHMYLLLENVRRLNSQKEQLYNYREEYRARWTNQFRQSAAIEVVQSYQAFVTRLDHALEQLQSQVLAAETQAQQARELLVTRETRVASVRKLLGRKLAEQSRHGAMREQRQSDERAAIARWHATPALMANH